MSEKVEYWWCSHCKEEVDGRRVTFGEQHDSCGHPVEWIASSGSSELLNAATELAQKFRGKAQNSDRPDDCLTVANQLERAVRMAEVLGI